MASELDKQIANIKAGHGYVIHDTDFDLVRLLVARLSSQEAEIERLREALKPFADDAERLRNYPDDYPYGFPITPITVGDFRRARAALTPLPEGGQ